MTGMTDRSLYTLWYRRAATPREPCQASARFYWKSIEPHLTSDERSAILAAWALAASGSRHQLDDVVVKIGQRYFPGYKSTD